MPYLQQIQVIKQEARQPKPSIASLIFLLTEHQQTTLQNYLYTNGSTPMIYHRVSSKQRLSVIIYS